jgi:dienelactone hydrolase
MSDPNQFFPQQPGFGPQSPGGGLPNPPTPSRGPSCLLIGLFILGGGALTCGLVCCGGVMFLSQPPRASAAARELFDLGDVPLPTLPDRGRMTEVVPRVLKEEASFSDTGDAIPGHGSKLLIYLPAGQHKPQSLPCILITGAGSNLLSGMSLGDGDSNEHIPYAQAGYAVVAYELDGKSEADGDVEEMRRAYEAFKASRAGLVNARNALQYVLEKVPEVNPQQIYAAGHSSAGTHALLFAEHEPRLAGVIAYAPAISVTERFGPALRAFSFQLPGVVDFAAQSSPDTHRQRLKCPTFLFHAEDDSNCSIDDTRAFYQQLNEQGTEVTFETAKTGDHYQSMIDEGIPAAIRWLRQQERKK